LSRDCRAEQPGLQHNFFLVANFLHFTAAHDKPHNTGLKQPSEENVQAIVALEACMLVKIVGNVVASITVGPIFVINDEQFPYN
jgi:hypothetical protein